MPSAAQIRKAGNYARRLADDMGLRDWTISITSDEPSAEELGARGGGVPVAAQNSGVGRKECELFFSEAFFEDDYGDDQRRETVVHELIHAHMTGMWHMIYYDLEDHMNPPAYAVFHDSFRRSMEYATDALAEALAPHMPAWK